MGYWIFQNVESKLCTAVEDQALQKIQIHDDLGELLHDGPMPQLIANMYVTKFGGTLVRKPSEISYEDAQA